MPYQDAPSQHKADRFLLSSLSCSTCAQTSIGASGCPCCCQPVVLLPPYSADTTQANSASPGQFRILPVPADLPTRAIDPYAELSITPPLRRPALSAIG